MIFNIQKAEYSFSRDEFEADEKLALLNIAMNDRRLSARDLKVYMFLLNVSLEDYTQEKIADFLSMTRVNVNRSVSKLRLLNYISKEQSNTRSKMKYEIIRERVGVIQGEIAVLDIDKYSEKEKLTGEDLEYFNREKMKLREHISSKALNVGLEVGCVELDSLLSDDVNELLLLMASTNHPKAQMFQGRYLEDTIKFNIDNDVFIDKELFLKVYYLLSKEKEYKLDELMLVAGRAHRDTSTTRNSFYLYSYFCLHEYNEMIDFLVDVNELEEAKFLRGEESKYKKVNLSREFDNIRCVNTEKNTFSEAEFLYIVWVLNCDGTFKRICEMDMVDYMKIKTPDLASDLQKVELLRSNYEHELKVLTESKKDN